MGYSSIVQKITSALSLAKVSFKGTGGIGGILNDLATSGREGSIRYAPDTASLSLLSGADATWAIVPGKALYRYNRNALAILPASSLAAFGGGQWEVVMIAGGAPHKKLIGDAVSLTHVVTHNKEVEYPDVKLYNTINGLPYSKLHEGVDYTLSVTDANNILITTTIPLLGNSTAVVVKA